MNKSFKNLLIGTVWFGTVMFSAGCGGSNGPSEGITIQGNVVKGAVSGAMIELIDANGTVVQRGETVGGKFTLTQLTLQSRYYILRSYGGHYTDEATGQDVAVPKEKGLKTFLTKAELQQLASSDESVLLTPETTVYTELVKAKLEQTDPQTAEKEAEKIVYDFLIKDSSPMPGMGGDKFAKSGDLTKAVPTNSTEAFAKNRAVAYSTMVRELGLSPEQVFEILPALSEDLKDNKVDGIELEGKKVKIPQEYALARMKLFQETTSKLRDGNLTEAQIAELEKMGFDVASIQNDKKQKEQKLSSEVRRYLASDSLPSLHILPLLSDEDGNPNDAEATYTLSAYEDVNVTIETPDGSWITPMWRYNRLALPPVIKAKRGMLMKLHFQNHLQADSTIHWHGFKIPAVMDGGPDIPVAPGTQKLYTFTMQQPAAPLWFHPHPDMQTGKQVYMGLAGVFLLEDNISKQLEADKALPSGERDVVLLVQDRRFAPKQNGVRALQYKTMEMDSDGMLGDVVLVNGSVVPKLEVGTAQYRLRLYNVSNARTYDFAFSDNRKFTIVATDGGLLAKPVEVDHIRLGAAERVELVVDFSRDTIASKVLLVSRPAKGDMMGMMNGMGNMNGGMSGGNMSGGSGNMNGGNGMSGGMQGMGGMNGRDTDSNGNGVMGSMPGMAGSGEGLVIMRFDVTKAIQDDVTLYTQLPQEAEISTRLQAKDAVNFNHEREFVMSMLNGGMGNMGSGGMNGNGGGMNMRFVINGKLFDINRVDEYVGANTVEIWNIRNMSPMAHPFHAHATQYQILDRNGVPASGVDLGWKDTFLVDPGESVRVIAKFEEVNQGDYMYHCHILEHEDAGMMGYFRVGPTGNVGN